MGTMGTVTVASMDRGWQARCPPMDGQWVDRVIIISTDILREREAGKTVEGLWMDTETMA